MTERSSDDTNIQIVRSIPFWPTIMGALCMMFTGGGIYAKVSGMSDEQQEQKVILVTISSRLGVIQSEQAVLKVTYDHLKSRQDQVDVKIDDLSKELWKIQQAKKP